MEAPLEMEKKVRNGKLAPNAADGEDDLCPQSAADGEDDLCPQSAADGEDDLCPQSASQAFESLLAMVGGYSYYQWKLTFIAGFCGLFTSCHNMGAVFLGAAPDHWCNIPYFSERGITIDKSFLNTTVPWVRGKDNTPEHSKCSYFDHDYSTLYDPALDSVSAELSTVVNASLKTCDSWIYDNQTFHSTVVTEWDLVCSHRWMMPAIQATYMMGILTGAVLFSAISDKLGRRPSSLICCVLFFAASLATALANSFELFLVLRFIVAGSGQGMFLVNFVLLMETLSLKGRNVLGNLFQFFFAVGFVILSGLGYAIRDWRQLQLVISAPTFVLLAYFWILPESPRWLLMQGREEEGVEGLKVIAKANGRTFPSDEKLKPLLVVIQDEVQNKENKTVVEKLKSIADMVVILVRTPNMRRRNVIMFYTWFVTSMLFYGLSFNGVNFNVSLYVTVALSAAVSIPAAILTMILLLKFGRRTILSLSFLIGGVACIAIIFIPTDMIALNLVLSNIGKFNSASCFLLVFILSAELVPTNVRNMAMGMASMWARIGSAIVPFIVDLLGNVYYAIPSTIFGVLSIIAGLLTLLLPETGNSKCLPESVEEIEAMPR